MSKWRYLGAAALFAFSASMANAQAMGRSPLLSLGRGEMRAEVEKRYHAALAASLDKGIIAAPDGRYHFALAAKAECGIAIGFLKAGEVDEDSVTKCDLDAQRLAAPPPPAWTPPPPPPPPPVAPVADVASCTVKLPIVFYFGWNEDTPPAEAQPVAAQTIASIAACHWSGLNVVGHTDTSGSLEYNQALSERRAQNIAALLTSAGAQSGSLAVKGMGKTEPAVKTADGVREPLNRRVEVTPAAGQ